jgi:hypothetical protein
MLAKTKGVPHLAPATRSSSFNLALEACSSHFNFYLIAYDFNFNFVRQLVPSKMIMGDELILLNREEMTIAQLNENEDKMPY